MTHKEAFIILTTEHMGDSERMEVAKQMGAVALMRMTPRPPEMREDFGFGSMRSLCCPFCGFPVTNYWVRNAKPMHCQFCGQALDWGKETKT